MQLHLFDWAIIGAFFLIMFLISLWASKTAGKSKQEYFLAGKSMPWWLLGVSMVATTFAADTPNLVTGFVREGGIAKNWLWWSFLVTGMITVFIYARLWRRSEVLTDLEFYELRYSGKGAKFLRGFRAVYLGLFFNCLIMGSVMLAAIKIAAVLFGLSPVTTVVVSSILVAIYSAIGGIKGVIWTDFFQFGIALAGAIYAAYVAAYQPQIGGIVNLLNHPSLIDKVSFLPDLSNTSMLMTMFIVPLAVQWWSVWYPGAEPGGGGYIAQRMLAAKNEKHAIGATLFFNFAHYALRPWPWIIVALASLVLFPDLKAIENAFPDVDQQYIGNDLAYPVMLTLLSPGWLGLVAASLIAAFMSTISTHLNWGSSYLVNDVYHRFVKQDASEKKLVVLGRVATVLLMVISGILALTVLENASQAFTILLLSGAGTGSIFLLRWFWWRINAWTEIMGMLVATIVAFVLVLIVPPGLLGNDLLDESGTKLLLATGITTIAWVLATFLTKPENTTTLENFALKLKPALGWRQFSFERNKGFTNNLLSVFIGTLAIYAALFGVGYLLKGEYGIFFLLFVTFGLCLLLLIKWWKKQ